MKQYNNETMYNRLHCNRGFTLIELIVSMGIFTIIMGFSFVAYLNIQKSSDLANQTTQLVSSIRQAQALAISGQTLDSSTSVPVGIHFEEHSYTIFIGATYSQANDSNIITNLPSQITLNYTLPTANLLFTANAGDVNSFDPTKNTVTISHQDGKFRTINMNKLGIVNIN